jgi:hypothetical protein
MEMHCDQNTYLHKMISACESGRQWNRVKPMAEIEFRSLLMMIEWAEQMKTSGEFDLEQARIHVSLQKNMMYLRFQEVSGLPVNEAAQVINDAIGSVRKDLHEWVEWVII